MGKPPLVKGNQLGQKGSIWGCLKRVKLLICGRWDRVRNTQMISTTALWALAWDVCSQVFKGLGSGTWGLENRPGARTAIGCGEKTEGMGGRKSAAGNAYRGRLNCHGSRRYCWVTRRGRSHYCSLSLPTCQRLLTDNKRIPLRSGSCVPAARQ